jgi:hypothetical protein
MASKKKFFENTNPNFCDECGCLLPTPGAEMAQEGLLVVYWARFSPVQVRHWWLTWFCLLWCGGVCSGTTETVVCPRCKFSRPSAGKYALHPLSPTHLHHGSGFLSSHNTSCSSTEHSIHPWVFCTCIAQHSVLTVPVFCACAVLQTL